MPNSFAVCRSGHLFISFPGQGFDGTVMTVFYATAPFESYKKLMLSIALPFLFPSFILNRVFRFFFFFNLFLFIVLARINFMSKSWTSFILPSVIISPACQLCFFFFSCNGNLKSAFVHQ